MDSCGCSGPAAPLSSLARTIAPVRSGLGQSKVGSSTRGLWLIAFQAQGTTAAFERAQGRRSTGATCGRSLFPSESRPPAEEHSHWVPHLTRSNTASTRAPSGCPAFAALHVQAKSPVCSGREHRLRPSTPNKMALGHCRALIYSQGPVPCSIPGCKSSLLTVETDSNAVAPASEDHAGEISMKFHPTTRPCGQPEAQESLDRESPRWGE